MAIIKGQGPGIFHGYFERIEDIDFATIAWIPSSFLNIPTYFQNWWQWAGHTHLKATEQYLFKPFAQPALKKGPILLQSRGKLLLILLYDHCCKSNKKIIDTDNIDTERREWNLWSPNSRDSSKHSFQL